MSDSKQISKNYHPDPSVVESFAGSIEAFAKKLTRKERLILNSIVIAALEPHDRLATAPPAGLLSSAESTVLAKLKKSLKQNG
jgi:hypothetical protein